MNAAVLDWTDEHENLARLAVDHYFLPGGDYADLLQEARVGIWQGARDWQPNAGASRRNFMVLCARRRVFDAVTLANRIKHQLLNDALSFEFEADTSDDGGPVHIGDLLYRWWDDPLRIVIAREEARRLLRLMRTLTPWERECVERVRLGGEDYAFAGADRAKSVDNALQRAEKKLAANEPPTLRETKVYVDRAAHPSERQAVAAALRVVHGEVVSVSKRKLLDGHERAPQGRPDRRGRRGQLVWRVDMKVAA